MAKLPTQSRWAIVVIVSALFGAALLASGLELYLSHQKDVADTALQLAQLRSEIAAGPQLLANYKLVQHRLENHPYLFPADSPTLAAAKMEREIKAIVSKGGGDVRAAQILPYYKTGDLETVAARYDLAIPINRLQQVIYEMESHVPLLKIDNADIVAPVYQNAVPGSNSIKLDVHITVHGYRWGGPK